MTHPTIQDVNRWELEQALSKLDPARLRHLVVTLHETSQESEIEVMNYLFLGGKRKDGGYDAEGPGEKKRARLVARRRYERCRTCKKTFNVEKNNDKACRTHPEGVELDPEAFPDDDQVEYDPSSIDLETDWRREECPEGFIYPCCEKDCNAQGCEVQAHVMDEKEDDSAAVVGSSDEAEEDSDEDEDGSDEDEDEDKKD